MKRGVNKKALGFMSRISVAMITWCEVAHSLNLECFYAIVKHSIMVRKKLVTQQNRCRFFERLGEKLFLFSACSTVREDISTHFGVRTNVIVRFVWPV